MLPARCAAVIPRKWKMLVAVQEAIGWSDRMRGNGFKGQLLGPAPRENPVY
jgi:hypothetical protein